MKIEICHLEIWTTPELQSFGQFWLYLQIELLLIVIFGQF